MITKLRKIRRYYGDSEIAPEGYKEQSKIIFTPFGLVKSVRVFYGNTPVSSKLEFVLDGVLHQRQFKNCLSFRTLVSEAREFIGDYYNR